MRTQDGAIGHAEIRLGDSILLAFDSRPDWPDTPAMLRVYVADADAAFERAVAAGARIVTPIDPTAWGDRGGRIRDPLGNIWWVVQRVEDVPPDEMAAGGPGSAPAAALARTGLRAGAAVRDRPYRVGHGRSGGPQAAVRRRDTANRRGVPISGAGSSILAVRKVFVVPPGETASVPLLVGTDSFRPELGYAVPPGEWGLRATLSPELGRTPVLPLTIT